MLTWDLLRLDAKTPEGQRAAVRRVRSADVPAAAPVLLHFWHGNWSPLRAARSLVFRWLDNRRRHPPYRATEDELASALAWLAEHRPHHFFPQLACSPRAVLTLGAAEVTGPMAAMTVLATRNRRACESLAPAFYRSLLRDAGDAPGGRGGMDRCSYEPDPKAPGVAVRHTEPGGLRGLLRAALRHAEGVLGRRYFPPPDFLLTLVLSATAKSAADEASLRKGIPALRELVQAEGFPEDWADADRGRFCREAAAKLRSLLRQELARSPYERRPIIVTHLRHEIEEAVAVLSGLA
jgi:hypothetical protein